MKPRSASSKSRAVTHATREGAHDARKPVSLLTLVLVAARAVKVIP